MIPESAQEEDQHASKPVDNVPCERVSSDTCIRCGDFDKVFSTKSNLNRHRKVHMGNMIPCTLCNKTFFCQYDLQRHRDSAHYNHKFECGFASCSKAFKSKLGLKNHKLDHIGNYKHSQCGKGFNYRTTFDIHMNKHEGRKPYKCEKCDKSFTAKTNMTRHMELCGISEKANQPFSCDQCGKNFKCKRYLSKHLKSHAHEEKYQCSTCGSMYKYCASLYKHKRHVGHE